MPTQEAIEKAIELLRQSANYQYFFEKLDSSDWVEPLFERGFFQSPPEPIREGDYVRLPIWVESRYLVRVAAEVPDLVVRILNDLPATDNARVHEDFVDVACKLPPELASSLAPAIVGFIDSPFRMLLPGKVKDYAIGLVRAGYVEPAVKVARALLEPAATEPRDVGGFTFPAEPRPRFTFPDYGELLQELLSAIGSESPQAEFGLAIDLLDRALAIVHPDGRKEDFSYIWREAIEESPRNSRHREVLNDLVTAVRDSRIWESGDLGQLVSELETRSWPVFRRLALHEIRTHPERAGELVNRSASDLSRLFEPSTYHERVLLLRDALVGMDREESTSILDAISAGPKAEGVESEEDEERRLRWAYRTLAALKSSLPPYGLDRLRAIEERLGVDSDSFVDPEFLSGSSSGVWVGPTSPVTADELLAMPDDELVEYLSRWRAPEEWHSPTPDGLGRVLQEAVEADADRFSRRALNFVGLDATYVRSVLQGLRDAYRKEAAVDWPSSLRLCEWAVEQEDPREPRSRDRDGDPDWSWSRRAVASLLHDGLAISERSIPQHERDLVWRILSRLVEDSDPTPDHEEQYGGSNMDPVTLSLNTVRGEAFRALVRYTLWVRAAVDEGHRRGFADMPEARDVLDRHLDLAIDQSLAVRSVYGQFYPWLHLVDSEWAEALLDVIFPADLDRAAWFEAAWDAYIVYTQPFDRMAEVMRPAYTLAVDRIPTTSDESRSRDNPGDHLAEHLAVFVVRDVLQRHDALVDRFFEVSPPALRGHVHEFLGRSFHEVPPPEEAAGRSMALWEERLAYCQQSEDDDAEELVAFGWWFIASAIDADWRLGNLLAVLRATGGRIAFPSSVFEELVDVADEHPREALQAVQLMVRGAADEGWEIVAGRDSIRAVLVAGLHGDMEVRTLATELTHELGARGYGEFRSVFDGG